MERKIQPTLLRKLNERAVFDLVRSQGPISRAQLTRISGISAPTASKAVANLLEAGFLEELEIEPDERDVRVGRPSKVYCLGRQTVQVLAGTIDVRRCCVLAAGLDGRIDDEQVLEFPTPGTYEELIDAMAQRAKQLMRRRRIPTLGMGISTPGEIDVKNQRVLLSPNLHMTDGRSPGADLSQKLGVETVIFHETIGTCLAERAYGAARGMNDFVMVGVYEGFGASVVSGGRLLEGHENMAGEVGHITVDLRGEPCGCGNNGCLETFATDAVFARKMSRRLGKRMEVEQIIQLCAQGQLDPEPELTSTLEYLAVGIAALINIFNPEAVLVCSRMLDADPRAFKSLIEFVTRRSLKPLMRHCRILRAEGNTRQGAVAAIIHHLTHAVGPVLE